MQAMNISLPDPLKDFIDHRIAEGRYSSVSEYIRELIRDDEKRKAEERLEALLLEGLKSGEESELTKQDFEDIRKEAMAQLKRHKKKG
jgi:antitoxin ParD1/3/4